MHGRSLRFALLALSILTLGTAHAATVSPVAPGLSAAIGQAFHPVTQEVFFVEWTSGEFSKVDPASGTVTTINNGFVNPQDVALLPGHPLAYITTRDGKLWKVATGSAAKSQVTSGLGKPHQLVLDPAAFVAYTVDFAGGNFWKVSLGGGVPTAIATGLTNPLGLVMTPDFKTAYISEPNRILKVDVASGTSTVVISGLSNLFFMDWADDVQSALYVVSRDPANYLLRVDLTATPAGPFEDRARAVPGHPPSSAAATRTCSTSRATASSRESSSCHRAARRSRASATFLRRRSTGAPASRRPIPATSSTSRTRRSGARCISC